MIEFQFSDFFEFGFWQSLIDRIFFGFGFGKIVKTRVEFSNLGKLDQVLMFYTLYEIARNIAKC